MLVAVAPVLVYKDYPVFRTLVNGLPRAACHAGGIGAMVTYSGQIEKPHWMGKALYMHSLRHLFACNFIFTDIRLGPVLEVGKKAFNVFPLFDGLLKYGLSRIGLSLP